MPSPSVTVVDAQSSVSSDIEKGIAPGPKVTAEETHRSYLVPSREASSVGSSSDRGSSISPIPKVAAAHDGNAVENGSFLYCIVLYRIYSPTV